MNLYKCNYVITLDIFWKHRTYIAMHWGWEVVRNGLFYSHTVLLGRIFGRIFFFCLDLRRYKIFYSLFTISRVFYTNSCEWENITFEQTLSLTVQGWLYVQSLLCPVACFPGLESFVRQWLMAISAAAHVSNTGRSHPLDVDVIFRSGSFTSTRWYIKVHRSC